VDLEIGGNDQTFNMLAGRTLLREMKHREKFVLTCKLLADQTGKKMGKTEGNMITLGDAPEDMYGKVMSWTDGMIVSGFELCTDVSKKEIDSIHDEMEHGENPVSFKRRLAAEIVKTFIGAKEASSAAEQFDRVHRDHEIPEVVPTWKLEVGSGKLVDVLVETKLASSKSDARRQIEQGGVKVNESVVSEAMSDVKAGDLIQKGKRHFVRLI
jgi:tyrosyl-tRNA synthetase